MPEAPLNTTTNEEVKQTQEAALADASQKSFSVGELAGLLTEIRDANVKQAKSQRLRTIFMGIFAGATVALALYVFFTLSGMMTNLMPRIESSLDDLNTVTSNLAKVDIVKISNEISDLALTGTEGITTALKGLDTALADVSRAISVLQGIDITGLNESISDLGAIVGPMARLFGN